MHFSCKGGTTECLGDCSFYEESKILLEPTCSSVHAHKSSKSLRTKKLISVVVCWRPIFKTYQGKFKFHITFTFVEILFVSKLDLKIIQVRNVILPN